MNFKKLISGIAAATIAASAFTAMAVTASADEPVYSVKPEGGKYEAYGKDGEIHGYDGLSRPNANAKGAALSAKEAYEAGVTDGIFGGKRNTYTITLTSGTISKVKIATDTTKLPEASWSDNTTVTTNGEEMKLVYTVVATVSADNADDLETELNKLATTSFKVTAE